MRRNPTLETPFGFVAFFAARLAHRTTCRHAQRLHSAPLRPLIDYLRNIRLMVYIASYHQRPSASTKPSYSKQQHFSRWARRRLPGLQRAKSI